MNLQPDPDFPETIEGAYGGSDGNESVASQNFENSDQADPHNDSLVDENEIRHEHESETESENVTDNPQEDEQFELRRSSRTRRPPEKFKDYYT